MDKMKKFGLNNKFFSLILLGEIIFFLYIIIKLFTPINVIDFPLEISGSMNEIVSYTYDDEGKVKTVTIKNDEFSENAVNNDIESEESNELVFRSASQSIPAGGYKIVVNYEVNTVQDEEGNNLGPNNIHLTFGSGMHTNAIKTEELEMIASEQHLENRLWVTTASRINDLKMQINYEGYSVFTINDVKLVEQPIYRIVSFIGFILLFSCINFIYLFLFAYGLGNVKNRVLKHRNGILLILVWFASMILFFNDFMFTGHDLTFHIGRIGSIASELSYGQFPVRIMTDMVNEYSYPTSLFYCDIFLYIPAILYNCMIPMQTCYAIYVGMVNLATILISYYCFKEITKNTNISVVGTIVYTFATYRLTNLIIRSSVGEYTAMVFIPLVILGVYKIYKNNIITYKEWMPLSFGMSGIVCCHILSLEMSVIFLGMFCVFAIRKTLVIPRLFALVKASILTVLLSFWFLIPMLHSMLVNPMKVGNITNYINSRGIYLFQLLGMQSLGVDSGILKTDGQMPLMLGWAIVIGVGLVVYCWIHKEEWGIEKLYEFNALIVFVIFGGIASLFTLKIFPWGTIGQYVGELGRRVINVIQFPWRYLAFATVFFVFAIVLALMIIEKHNAHLCKVCSITLIAVTIVSYGLFLSYVVKDENTEDNYSMNYEKFWEVGGHEYFLEKALSADLRKKEVYTLDGGATIGQYDKVEGVYTVECNNTSDIDSTIVIPIFAYNRYVVYDKITVERFDIVESTNGLINVIVPVGYDGTLVVEFVPSTIWRISEIISLISMLTTLFFLGYKRNIIKIKKEK